MLSINLTTTFARQEICAQAVYSLMRQSILPDKIRIWVSKTPYLSDTGILEAPQWIADLNKIRNIVEIHWTQNTGPYRKLIPALRSASDDDIIVTADDDIIYGKNWLKHLLARAEEAPSHVIAARVRKISNNIFGKRKTYLSWPIINRELVVESNFIVTHGGGTLLRKRHISERLAADETYLDICPTTDDLWFSKLITKSNTKVVICPQALSEIRFIEHEDGLDNQNNLKPRKLLTKIYQRLVLRPLGWLGLSICGNDVAFKKIEEHNFIL
ncbi:glycosyltransferase [Pseudomonas knackmussii]|uniref:glycosyltransferase n=1 Tax=Pseudomonas knackmussii TaxID=65741 RepID=UPI003F49DA51